MSFFSKYCNHKWQHYGVNYTEERYDSYSQKHLDSYIEHFRACKRCGKIQRRNPETKKWEII